MTAKKYFFFDLDGTVTDPKEGITKSVRYSLHQFGIYEESLDVLTKFIGPPLQDSYREFYGFTEAQAEAAVSKYREYYADKGIFENVLYSGMAGLLKDLSECGRNVVLATSKPIVYAEKILKHFKISEYFAFVSGSELDGRRVKKGDVIRYALENMKISDKSEVIMIGDRMHDIIGAKENGLESIGVLYGYGNRGELSAAGATLIVENIEEIRKYACIP